MSSSSMLLCRSGLLAALLVIPTAALAFNPQPDPPGKRKPQSKSLGGPDTKAFKGGKGSWKRIHEVDEKAKSKGGAKSLPAVQKKPK